MPFFSLSIWYTFCGSSLEKSFFNLIFFRTPPVSLTTPLSNDLPPKPNSPSWRNFCIRYSNFSQQTLKVECFYEVVYIIFKLSYSATYFLNIEYENFFKICWFLETFIFKFQVNIVVFPVSAEVVSRQSCLAALSICHSGFSFPETNFRAQVCLIHNKKLTRRSDLKFDYLKNYSSGLELISS